MNKGDGSSLQRVFIVIDSIILHEYLERLLKMKVTYIYHSCFVVELSEVIFIFDYFKGELPEFSKEKRIVVFVSHKHRDHFSHSIFQLALKYQNITYVLSKDTKMSENYRNRIKVPKEAEENIIYMNKNETIQLEDSSIVIHTLESTDQGVAFVIDVSDNSFYHAGDLNWWTWVGETEEEYEDMKQRFQLQMEKIKGRHFDVAFVPLDPRQEERFFWGLDAFMRNTNTDLVFPMHFWEDYSVITKLKNLELANSYSSKIVELIKEGQVLKI